MIKEGFISYIANVRKLSGRTIEEYWKSLIYFETATGMVIGDSRITSKTIDEYIAHLNEQNIQPATIKARISALRSCYRWAEHQGMAKSNPAKYTSTPKIEEKLPQPQSIERIKAFINEPTENKERQEVQMLAAVILETGARLNEALNIKCDDFINGQTLQIHNGKGSKDRIVYFGNLTRTTVKRRKPRKGEYLFTMTDEQARWAMYKHMGDSCPGIHPHAIRHCFACSMLNAGMNLKEVSQLLGHASVQTTERYAHMYNETIRNSYETARAKI